MKPVAAKSKNDKSTSSAAGTNTGSSAALACAECGKLRDNVEERALYCDDDGGGDGADGDGGEW